MSKLSEIFDVEESIINNETIQTIDISKSSNNTEDEDFEYSRAVQKELIETGRAAVNTAIRIASESESTQGINVLSAMLKTVADMNKQLLELSKDKNDIKAQRTGKNVQQAPMQIGTQNVLVGTSADLNKLLAQKLAQSV